MTWSPTLSQCSEMTSAAVSVVVPSYNKADYIAETIDSVLGQRGVKVEVIVVDDASTDHTLEVLEGYGQRIRLQRIGGNSGAAHARNVGASVSRGDYLMFLDADDLINPETLDSLVRALDGRTDRFAACPWQRIRLQDGEWVVYSPEKPLDPPGGDPVAAWLGNWYIPPCAILWPRQLFEDSGGWDEELAAVDDEELMIRMLLRGTEIAHAATGEAHYRFFKDGGTLSTTPSRRLAAGRLRAVEKLEHEAVALGALPRYRHEFGKKYYRIARTYLEPFPDLALTALRHADRLIELGRLPGPRHHRLLTRALGLERKERLARWVARRGWIDRRAAGGGSSAGPTTIELVSVPKPLSRRRGEVAACSLEGRIQVQDGARESLCGIIEPNG